MNDSPPAHDLTRFARILTVTSFVSSILALSTALLVNFHNAALLVISLPICVTALVLLWTVALRLEKASRWIEQRNAFLVAHARRSFEAARSAERKADLAYTLQRRYVTVSHALRQPVQALALFTEVLAQTTDDDKRRELVAAIERATQGLSTAIDDLHEVSRIALESQEERPVSEHPSSRPSPPGNKERT